jgi:hypothetical protein
MSPVLGSRLMSRAVVFASLIVGSLAGCRVSLDATGKKEPTCVVDPPPQVCMDAESHDDFTWIETNIFDKQCAQADCHDGGQSKQGAINLHLDPALNPMGAYAHLLGADGNGVVSVLAPNRKLVVPGQPDESYMLVMLGEVDYKDAIPADDAPDDISEAPDKAAEGNGYMPMSQATLICCQKLDAIQRWIMAGAMND